MSHQNFVHVHVYPLTCTVTYKYTDIHVVHVHNVHVRTYMYIHMYMYMYNIITVYVHCTLCICHLPRPSKNMHLCVSDFTLLQGQSQAELFDVVIILKSSGRVARSAYPTQTGTCNHKSSTYFDKCSFNNSTMKYMHISK